MDVRLRQLLVILPVLPLFYASPGSAKPGPINEDPTLAFPAPALTDTPPLRFTLTSPELLGAPPGRYGLDIEWQPTTEGNQRLTAYPSFSLTPQSSVSLSLNSLHPRLNFEGGGFKTSLRLRGNGIKLNIRPSNPDTRLEFALKITGDESRLDCKYRF